MWAGLVQCSNVVLDMAVDPNQALTMTWKLSPSIPALRLSNNAILIPASGSRYLTSSIFISENLCVPPGNYALELSSSSSFFASAGISSNNYYSNYVNTAKDSVIQNGNSFIMPDFVVPVKSKKRKKEEKKKPVPLVCVCDLLRNLVFLSL